MSRAISRTIDSARAILPSATSARRSRRRAARRNGQAPARRVAGSTRATRSARPISLGALVVPLARVRPRPCRGVAVHDERRLARPRARVRRAGAAVGRRALRGADVLPGAPDLQGPRPQDRRRRVGPRRAAHRHPRCQARRRLAAEAEAAAPGADARQPVGREPAPPSGGGSSSRWRRSTTSSCSPTTCTSCSTGAPTSCRGCSRTTRRTASRCASAGDGGERDDDAAAYDPSQTPPSGAGEKSGSDGHVVSVGSFTKILSPGLRLGWLEAAPSLLARVAERGYLVSGGGVAPFVSEVVAEVLSSGAQNEVLDSLCADYAEKSSALVDALRAEGLFEVEAPPDGGTSCG